MEKRRVKLITSFLIIILVCCLTYIVSAKVFKYNKPVTNEITQIVVNPEDKKEEKEDLNYLFSPDVDLNYYRELYNNKNIVGRLEIPNMFNILLTQSTNNEYYLNHSIDNKKDIKGTEYIDYRVTTDSQQINIYGHNSKTYDIPFRKLEKYLDEDFFNNNQYILLQDDKGRKIYRIFAIKEVNKDYSHMKVNLTGEEFLRQISNLGNNVIYKRDIDFDQDSKILVLQTCSYASDESYYVITAILEE